MANPFLMEDPVGYAEPTAIPSNPFLFGSDQPFMDNSVPDNPFLTSISTAPGTNPFADYTWDEPTGNDPGLLTPPHTSNINDPENDFIVSSDDEASKPRRPPPPRPSMPKETQDLILSVTGALKATSDHLLERLPPTRAPSPTSFADLHSPSPTPDLLGGDDGYPPLCDPQPPSFSQPLQQTPFILQQPVHEPQQHVQQAPILQQQQQEIHQPITQPPAIPQQPQIPQQAPQPARPPPPRPPSRPAPPQVPPPPVVSSAKPQQSDEFDLFGAPMAPQPKSKDAILNLYSQPPKPQQKDLLSDDIDLPPIVNETSVPSIVETTVENQSPIDEDKYYASQALAEQNAADEAATNAADTFGIAAQPIDDTPTSLDEATGIFGTEQQEGTRLDSAQNSFILSDTESPQTVFEMESSQSVQTFESPTGGFAIGQVEAVVTEASQTFSTAPLSIDERPNVLMTAPMSTDPANLFGSEETTSEATTPYIFGTGPNVQNNAFGIGSQAIEETPTIFGVGPSAAPSVAPTVDAFDAFAAKFEQADEHKSGGTAFDPFGGGSALPAGDAWGATTTSGGGDSGFGADSDFDAFLSMSQPPRPPQPTPNPMNRAESAESEDGGFNVFIKPREGGTYAIPSEGVPALAPPPKSPAYSEVEQKFNPFDKNGQIPAFPMQDGFQLPALSQTEPYEGGFKRTDSQETPPTPLFDEDVSQPLEDFPRIHYAGEGWEMQLRHPNKKKITGQRFWKKIFVKLVYQGDNPVLQLFNLKEDKDPFQELPLQACYSVSEISAQQYDQFGKIFTVKLQYIFYKERPGVRPGQVTKAERITNKLSQFAAYAIQGDYQGVKEFGSDLKKLGLPVEHAPQISQLLKLGCINYDDLKQFSVTIEECLFRMPVHRDRALNYKMEEVQITVVDEMYVEQDAYGHVEKQIARVRLFFLAFLSGMPDVELGMNDLWRQGKEVVGRHDIVPVVTEEWIRLESVEFHNCVQLDEYEQSRTIKFKPPDACYIELMRFRIRPPKNRELPLQLKAVMCVTGNKVELRADVLVPGFTSRKLGQIPCEDVMIRFPIPECWIYLFRVEKHFRYGSVKSAHRRTGKIKGIERFLGAVDNMEPSLMEVTSGQAKYEHQHRSIVWRMPRLPKEGQGAYTTHNLVCRMQLTSFDQIPDNLAEYAYVEFTMPATTASHTTVRSVSLVDSPSDNPPEKYVRQLARLEYRVGIEHTQGEEAASYIQATQTKPKPPPEPAPTQPPPAADSDSDSSG